MKSVFAKTDTHRQSELLLHGQTPKAEDVVRDDARDAAVEAYIEERRQKALKMIAKMDEAE